LTVFIGVRRRSFGLEKIEMDFACSATPDVPEASLAIDTIEDEHEGVILGACDVRGAGIGEPYWV